LLISQADWCWCLDLTMDVLVPKICSWQIHIVHLIVCPVVLRVNCWKQTGCFSLVVCSNYREMSNKRNELAPETIICTCAFHQSDISTMSSWPGRSIVIGTNTLSSCLCGGNISESSDDSSVEDGTNLAEKLKLMKEKAKKRKRNLKLLRWSLYEEGQDDGNRNRERDAALQLSYSWIRSK
jgi:hypothetical protein